MHLQHEKSSCARTRDSLFIQQKWLKMNILFLSELFYPHGGGAELATFLYAKLLSEAGFNIAVVTNRFVAESEVSKNENLIIYRLNLVKDNGIGKYSILQRFDVLFSSFMRKMVKWADVVYASSRLYSYLPHSRFIRCV